MTAVFCGDSGKVWAGTKRGLVTFDGANWNVYNSTNSIMPMDFVTAITQDQTGKMWFASAGYYNYDKYGLLTMDGSGAGTVYNTATSDLSDDFITCLLTAPDGNLWMGTYGGGLVKFNGTNTWTIYQAASSGLPGDIVRALALDSLGNIWVGTSNGLASFNGVGLWTAYDMANSGMLVNSVTALAVDPQGNKWIGTEGGGVTVCNACPDLVTGLEQGNRGILSQPQDLTLGRSFPNPFKPFTRMSFSLRREAAVNISVYNMSGQLVSILIDHRLKAGSHSVIWKGVNGKGGMLPSGIYFYRITLNNRTAGVRRLVLLK
jgi:hypothetical protein